MFYRFMLFDVNRFPFSICHCSHLCILKMQREWGVKNEFMIKVIQRKRISAMNWFIIKALNKMGPPSAVCFPCLFCLWLYFINFQVSISFSVICSFSAPFTYFWFCFCFEAYSTLGWILAIAGEPLNLPFEMGKQISIQ